ncbi:alpha/beta hydrolase [Hoyosella sp. YIM 151337]|uniref:alpha/beta fold hydrolase n=1 Tax=Hoyosella sp. YIM 151337 TaxID=2992742 RepID=UPI0022363E9F|nr:alpha/beta hydrolase [Hoyosella sp. YIM 151337]MCW4351728.1 alpha/beta hydrolase [Hoyosella sp. YIM 151337]
MQRFDFKGDEVAFVRAGAGDPIVFLHNGGTSHAIWRFQIAQLARDHEVFALDLPGYGASARPRDGYTLDTYTDLVEAFVDHQELPPITLVGNCMGSAIALNFACRRSADVRCLVLINPLTEATLMRSTITGALYWLDRKLPLAGRLAGRVPKLPRWLPALMTPMLVGTSGRRERTHRNADLHAALRSEGEMRSLTGLLADIPRYRDLDALQPKQDIPGFPRVCTIWGEQNRVLSADAGRVLNESLRPERAEWLEQCGHLPMLEEPHRVTDIITSFVHDADEASEPRA